MTIWEINAWKLFLAGGPVMWPILLCSIFALGVIIEKIWFFTVISRENVHLHKQLLELVRKNKFKDAIEYCERNSSPITNILKAGIIRIGYSKSDIRDAIEDASLFEIPVLERRLSILATIANIAPLLGLLGTVAGIIGSFHTIQARSTTLNPMAPGELVGGIGEALVCTLAGLLVAIPTFVAYNYCVSRVKNLVLDMERAATELVDFISQLSDPKSRLHGES